MLPIVLCTASVAQAVENLDNAVVWLENESQRMIHACRREMHDAVAAFPPQVGIGYEAFWLRDYAYMLEGYIQGFTEKELDTARKQGDVLFSSLLFVQASRQLVDLLETMDRADQVTRWGDEAKKVSAKIREVFWDAKLGLFRAATHQCREPDIWGSALAVYLNVATKEQALAIAGYFKDHYGEIVQLGQIRHLPGGVYWEQADARDEYQNGAYWSTPTGWFVYTLDLVDSTLADETVIDMVNDFRQRGCIEWCFGETARLPNYLASGTNPLAGIRKMVERRKQTN